MPLQSVAAIHIVIIAIHLYNYKSHFPRPIMYYYIFISPWWVMFSFWVHVQYAVPLSLSDIILVLMFVFYLGVAGRQPLQGYAAPPFPLLYVINLYVYRL